MTALEDPEALRRVIHDLEMRVAALEDENEALAEGHEDALLLGLVTEQIQNEDGTERILRQGLERVSVLKAVPFCACLDVRGRKATLVQHYCSLTDAVPPRRDLAVLRGRGGASGPRHDRARPAPSAEGRTWSACFRRRSRRPSW